MTPSVKTVAVLFADSDSIYKRIPGCDVWDAERDARHWPGGAPVVAHPPCRAWGRLRTFANVPEGERELAILGVEFVRGWGGVLEHPYKSTLWPHLRLPLPGERDFYGGFTIALPQWWLGHKAEKASWFYIVGISPNEVPEVPLKLGEAEFVIQSRKRSAYRPHVKKRERSATPRECADWLLAIARKTRIRELCI